MEFRILGPVEARSADETVALGSDKQRALLAILLLHANEVVSAERLIDGLWGERPPPTALRTLQAHISRLRKALDHRAGAPVNDRGEPSTGGPNGALVTRGHGYLLRVAPGELDLDRFTGLVEQGRQALAAGDPGSRPRFSVMASTSGAARRWPTSPTTSSRGQRSRDSRSFISAPSRTGLRRTWRSDATSS